MGVVGDIHGLGRGTRTVALFVHRAIEGGLIHVQTRLGDELFGEFNGKAVSIVQLKGHVAREHRLAGFRHLVALTFEQR